MGHRLISVTAFPGTSTEDQERCLEAQARRLIEAEPDLQVIVTGGEGSFRVPVPSTARLIQHPEITWNREVLFNQAALELYEEGSIEPADFLLFLNFNVLLNFKRFRALFNGNTKEGCIRPYDDPRRLSSHCTDKILNGARSIVLGAAGKSTTYVPFSPVLIQYRLFESVRGFDEMLPYHMVTRELYDRADRISPVHAWKGMKAFELDSGGLSPVLRRVNREYTQRMQMSVPSHIREVDSKFPALSDDGVGQKGISDLYEGDPAKDTAAITIHQGRDPVRVAAHIRSMEWWLKQKGDCNVYIGEVVLDGGEPALASGVAEKNDPRLHLMVLRGNEREHGTLFQKEAVLNEVTVSHVPKEAKYLLFIDADGWTDDPSWFLRMRMHLKNNPECMLQGFSHLQDTREPSFVKNSYAKYQERQEPDGWYAPGFVWAMTRENFDRRCGWNPFGIVGCGDLLHLMECGGRLPRRTPRKRWLTDAMRPGHPLFRIDYLPMRVWHEYHGPHGNRKYALREQIPDMTCRRIFDEVVRDTNGLIRWINPDSPMRQVLEQLPGLDSLGETKKAVQKVAGNADPMQSAEERRKPSFVVAGVMKSGSTAALLNLSKHPCIWACRRDEQFNLARDTTCWAELHYWDRDYNFVKGFDWYLDFFQQAPETADHIGEHSPNITGGVACSEDPLKRIADKMPDLKLIIMLRNPVTRFYSHWHHCCVVHPDMPFIEFDRLVTDRESNSSAWSTIYDPGCYAKLIQRVRSAGLSAHFMIMERVQARPLIEYRKACSFLGADPALLPETANQVYRHIVRSDRRDPLKDDLRIELARLYASEVGQARELLDDPVPEWGEDFVL